MIVYLTNRQQIPWRLLGPGLSHHANIQSTHHRTLSIRVAGCFDLVEGVLPAWLMVARRRAYTSKERYDF